MKLLNELKITGKRIYRDIVHDRKLARLFFQSIDYMRIGSKTPNKFQMILSQLSTVSIICVLFVGIDISQYRTESMIGLGLWVILLIGWGYIYKRKGYQELEDTVTKDMNPLSKRQYDWIKEIHEKVCDDKK